MTEYVVRAKNITKQFKNLKANDDVCLNIKRGEIYGFIGRNGAGKTTFMKMLCGLSTPDSGEFELFQTSGCKIADHRKRIGNLIEDPGFFPNMTAKQNLHCKALSLGVHKLGYEEELLDLVGLKDVGKKKVKKFSFGMKQRLGIAMALLGSPDLLVLDEPINGLDPQGIVEIREILLKLKNEKNITIMISSHLLEELYKIADRFCFINNGRILEELSKEELLDKNSDYIRVLVDDTSKAATRLENLGITSYKVVGKDKIHIYERLSDSGMINAELNKQGIIVSEIAIVHENLEKYYLNLAGERK